MRFHLLCRVIMAALLKLSLHNEKNDKKTKNIRLLIVSGYVKVLISPVSICPVSICPHTPRQTQHRQDCFVVSGAAVWLESGPTARQVRSVSGLCRSVSGGAVRPPGALRRRTHLPGGQFTPPHQTRQDWRACLSTATAETQARQAATPSRPTAMQRHCTL